MRRREFVVALGSVAAWPLAARGQQPVTKIPRVGWLVTGTPSTYRFSLAAFRDGLKALGYIEGRNINIEYRWGEGDPTRLPQLANELVLQNVDIIVAGASIGAISAKRATSRIPIVAAGIGDLVELGLVPSLTRPGGNLTGFVAAAPEAAAKRLEILKEISPQARRATILLNQSSAKLEGEIAQEFAAANKIEVQLYDVRNMEQLNAVLNKIPQSSADIFLVISDPLTFTYRKLIVDAMNRLRIPTMYGFREFVDDGGLISFGASIADTYRRAAGYVDKILNGEKPADLPVQLPTKFELIINLSAAKMIGLDLPQLLLARADEVIE